jgi:hypothetical protein
MRAVFTILVAIAFIVPGSLISIAKDHKTALPQKKGHAYLCGTYWTYSSDEFWNVNGKRREAYNEFEQCEYNLYAEYGVNNRNTVSLNGAWARINESVNGRAFGFEELELGWKHFLGTKWSHSIAAELVAILPVETDYKPGLRYGQYGGEFNMLLTKAFDLCKRRGSYDLRLGYRSYCGFPSDQIRADAIVNITPFSRVILSASGHLEYGVFNGSAKEDESFFLLNPNYRLFRGQLQATIHVYRGASVFAGYQRHLWGRNVGTQGGCYGGAQIQF